MTYKDINRCSRCVLPETYPHIFFNDDGVCNYCLNWDKRWKNFDFKKSEKKLLSIFEEAKNKNRRYDCLVPLSGGRDSTYVLYLIKVRYGLNPLAITFNNGFMSDYALSNMQNTVKILSVDHIFHTYNWGTLKKMYQTAVKTSGEFCSICTSGINYVKQVYQQRYKIPLSISGGSARVDEQSPFEIISSNPVYVRKMLSQTFSEDQINEFVLKRWKELSPWELIKRKITDNSLRVIRLPDFVEWKMDAIQDVLAKELGWQTPDKKKDHIDCKFASVKTYLKNQQISGFVFKQAKYSQLIRDGQMTRDEALAELAYLEGQKEDADKLGMFMQMLDLTKKDIEGVKHKSHLDIISKEETEIQDSFSYKVFSFPWKTLKTVRG